MSEKYLAAVKLNKDAPKPYCCLTHPVHSNRGIIGVHYNASTGPISIVDSKTLVLKQFSLDGTKAPDGWIFAGNGQQVQRGTGQKAMIVGRDTPTRQCSLKKNYQGDSDLVVQLNKGQTIYNIDYLSIFCYQYDVDFGHMEIKLEPNAISVPAYIPPVVRNGELNRADDDDSHCPLYE
ncbi:electron transfer DM13 domain-containing protein [Ditylenchus destructor]|nr:electron transfer DM13 domain-containing protein [Ditylenchus destructor]